MQPYQFDLEAARLLCCDLGSDCLIDDVICVLPNHPNR